MSRRCYAVLPAAGTGSRMLAQQPKQYLEIAGRTLLEHSLQALLQCSRIEQVVVALHPEDDKAKTLALLSDPRVLCVTGGAQRCDSVAAGLEALSHVADPLDWVLVHDAARPCVAQEDLNRLIDAVLEQGVGAILAEPVVDTVKEAADTGLIQRTVDRSRLWRAQTPQMFCIAQLRAALTDATGQGFSVTDEASAMEHAGYPVQLVPGSASNLKVTVPEDLPLAEWHLQRAERGL